MLNYSLNKQKILITPQGLVLSGHAHLNISGIFLSPVDTGMFIQDFLSAQKRTIFIAQIYGGGYY